MKTSYLAFFFLIFIILIFSIGYPLNKMRKMPDDNKYHAKYGRYIEEAQDIVAILGSIAAAAGLIFLAYQFKRERDLHEAEYIMRLNQNFITNPNISKIYKKLEDSKSENQVNNPFEDEDIINMANYLSYFETFYPLITNKILKLRTIDPVLAYRFFLATNNKYMQEMLLCKKGKEPAWMNIYLLHRMWKEHRGSEVIQKNMSCLKQQPTKRFSQITPNNKSSRPKNRCALFAGF